MRFTSTTSADGVTEQSFTVDEIPGVLWTPDHVAGPRPLILLGHGGGQHKRAPGIIARAVRFAAEGGFAAAAIDAPSHGDRPPSAEFTRVAGELRAAMAAGRGPSGLVAMHDLLADQAVADWQRVIGALQDLDRVDGGAIGYWGVSMGTGLGLPLLAAEPRIRAAVLGLLGLPGLAGFWGELLAMFGAFHPAAGLSRPAYLVFMALNIIGVQIAAARVFDAATTRRRSVVFEEDDDLDVPDFLK